MKDLLQNAKKKVFCKSTAKEVSFESSHHRISSSESKVRITLYSIINNTTRNCLDLPQVDCTSAKVWVKTRYGPWESPESTGTSKICYERKIIVLRVP